MFIILIILILFIIVMLINWEKNTKFLKWYQGSRLRRRVFLSIFALLFIRDEWLKYTYEVICNENDGFIVYEPLQAGARVKDSWCSYSYPESCLSALKILPQIESFEFPLYSNSNKSSTWVSMSLINIGDEGCPKSEFIIDGQIKDKKPEWSEKLDKEWNSEPNNEQCLIVKKTVEFKYLEDSPFPAEANINYYAESFSKWIEPETKLSTYGDYLRKSSVSTKKKRNDVIIFREIEQVVLPIFYNLGGFIRGTGGKGFYCPRLIRDKSLSEIEIAKNLKRQRVLFYAKAFGVDVTSNSKGVK